MCQWPMSTKYYFRFTYMHQNAKRGPFWCRSFFAIFTESSGEDCERVIDCIVVNELFYANPLFILFHKEQS